MNNMITDDMNTIFYVVKVNGQEVTAKFNDQPAATMAINNLPENQKMLAEVVAVTTDGKQILLG